MPAATLAPHPPRPPLAQRPSPLARGAASLPSGSHRMDAIAFGLDTGALPLLYPSASRQNAYAEIRSVLSGHGFNGQQGSESFGGESVNAVTCVPAVMDCTRRLPWFANCARDIQMLRIEELNAPDARHSPGSGNLKTFRPISPIPSPPHTP